MCLHGESLVHINHLLLGAVNAMGHSTKDDIQFHHIIIGK